MASDTTGGHFDHIHVFVADGANWTISNKETTKEDEDDMALTADDINKIAEATKNKIMAEVVQAKAGGVQGSSLRNNIIWQTVWGARAQQKLDDLSATVAKIAKKIGA